MQVELLLSVLAGITLLLVLILVVRMHAFIALLIASICVGLFAGMDGSRIAETVQNGMGSTLGFVAVVIGLGAMLGALLETSGGATVIATSLLRRFGSGKTSWALVLTGFVVAIPVFFDVALIILIPVLYSLQRRSGGSILAFAIPLLAGLVVTHTFVPPTPGPVAVAEILGADLGMVILVGILAGLPAAIIGGVVWGKYISQKILVSAPHVEEESAEKDLPSAALIFTLIGLPILLILARTVVQSLNTNGETLWHDLVKLVGHPFVALIIANLLAWYLLGIRRGVSRDKLLKISTKSFAPAGTIILLTGAGGVFKEVLVETGSGEMLATSLTSLGVPAMLFAFLAAVLIRILQGSATVAMITAAGLTAPLITSSGMTPMQIACITIAIASGATFLSHVNDSGFWLVSQYLGLTEKQTFRSWTVMTMLAGLTGLICAGVLYTVI